MKIERKDIIGVGAAIAVSTIFWTLNAQVFRPARDASNCQSNLKQVGLGMMQYVRDYDEEFPLRANWVDALWPYTKSKVIFQCPRRGERPNGYAMNARINDLNIAQMPNGSHTKIAMIFDSDANGLNATDNGSSFPKTPRHLKGSSVLFVDGHVAFQTSPQFAFTPEPRPTPYRKPTPIPTKTRR